jgi:hypothetical protein
MDDELINIKIDKHFKGRELTDEESEQVTKALMSVDDIVVPVDANEKEPTRIGHKELSRMIKEEMVKVLGSMTDPIFARIDEGISSEPTHKVTTDELKQMIREEMMRSQNK